MKKRIISFVLTLLIIITAMTGCGGQAAQTEQKGSDQVIDENSISVTLAPTSSEPRIQTVDYEYEQDLNIIDDNYRNYYEIFVASYCDTDGDGVGDINGIISKLDYISEMGFNGIWLMPIMPSPSYHKYDVMDYYSIDSNYGTLVDFKNLIAECHKRNIRLIIDYVFNHTSAKHPWFTQAVSYLEGLQSNEEPDLEECPSVGYYHFTKDYSGSDDYHRAGSSDWYYECVFWDQMPDLALESPELRTELEDIAKYWLDMGVDGFRLDAAKEYYSGATSKNIEVLQWFKDYVLSINPNAYIVGEVFDEKALIASYYQSGVTSFFDFPLAQYNGTIASVVRKLGTSSAKSLLKDLIDLDESYRANNPDYIDAPFLSNHDTTRVAAQCANNEDQMKMAAGILLTLKGSPFVYYGEEIGMNSMGDRDENKRLPMQWSTTDLTGMTNAPLGADAVEQKFTPLDQQLNDPLSIVNFYKRALRIRNENPEIARGELSAIDELTDKNICAVKKTYQNSEIVIVYNVNKESATVDLNNAGYGNLSIRGYMSVDGSAVTIKDGVLNMPLYSIVILK